MWFRSNDHRIRRMRNWLNRKPLCAHKTSRSILSMQLIIHTNTKSTHTQTHRLTQYNFFFFKSFFPLQNPHRSIPWCIFFRYSFSISNVIQFAQLKLLNPLLLLWIPNGKSNWPVYVLLVLLLLKMRHKSSNVKVKRRISHWTTMKNLAPSMPPPPSMCCCVLKAILSTVNSHTYCRPLTFCHFTNWNCYAKPMP